MRLAEVEVRVHEQWCLLTLRKVTQVGVQKVVSAPQIYMGELGKKFTNET